MKIKEYRFYNYLRTTFYYFSLKFLTYLPFLLDLKEDTKSIIVFYNMYLHKYKLQFLLSETYFRRENFSDDYPWNNTEAQVKKNTNK